MTASIASGFGRAVGSRITGAFLCVVRRLLPSGVRLRRQAHDQLPVLPVLSRQLRDTATQIEQAIVETCVTFQAMSAKAQQSVSSVQEAIWPPGAQTSFEASIATTQQALAHLLQGNLQSAELSRRAARRVDEVEQAMAHIVSISQQVDDIAFGIKILALNAKIEAVHVGQSGAGFGVVADEISRHAEQSTKVADDIRSTLDAQLKGICETRETLLTLSSSDAADAELSRRQVEQALTLLSDTHARMQASFGLAADISRDLDRDISQAVTSLQFQDRVTQRISHVVTALDRVHAALGSALDGSGREDETGATGPAHNRRALATLEATYTMAEEHRPRHRLTGTEGTGGSVELF